MPAISLARLRPKFAGVLGIFVVPLFLFIPVLHYSLDTPIGLMENSPYLADKFESASGFSFFLHMTFVESDKTRFRPFFEFWNGLIWKVFDDAAWIHHLSRWMLHFGAVAFFIAAFRRVSRLPESADGSPRRTGSALRIIPVALLAHLWLFFPNVPVVRVEAVEIYTIFFLGLCNWAAALMLMTGGEGLRRHALFFLGFLGLLLSKEVNVAPALWLLVCWWSFAIAKGVSARKFLAGTALTLTLFAVIFKVVAALEIGEIEGAYWISTTPILERFPENAEKILRALFQYETSATITAVFIFLLMALIAAVGIRVLRREIDGKVAFILLLLGEFISMFLVTSVLYDVTLRYWYILVPCLVTLLAFAAQFLLEEAKRQKTLAICAASALAIFIAYFVSANYYNFLCKTIVQHSARNLDSIVIAEVAQLLNDGKYVQAIPDDWALEEMQTLGAGWHWKARNYEMYWPNSPYGARSIHEAPPKDPRQPYYILDILGHPELMDTHANLVGRTDYGVLNFAAKVAHFVQGKTPHLSLDMLPLGEYFWVIYALPHNMGDYLTGLVAEIGEPVAQAFFNVHLDRNKKKIAYVKRPCVKEDVSEWFYLHLEPERASDLPEGRKQYGYDNLDFNFRGYGIRTDGVCLAMRALPKYPIAWIRTGQYVLQNGRPTWSTELRIQN